MPAANDESDRPEPLRKRDATRRRLLDEAGRLFREQGYGATTAAEIAKAAGVTERTFFRYFPTKSTALVANWQLHGDALRQTLDAAGNEDDLFELLRAALTAFVEHLAIDIESRTESAAHIYVDRAAFTSIVQGVLELEEDLAHAIGRHLGRSSEDFVVRLTANASLSVLRAAVRAFVQEPERAHLSELIDDGMDRLRGLFATLVVDSGRERAPAPREQRVHRADTAP